MKKIFFLLILSLFSAHTFAGSCSDGSDPVRSISADGTYFVYNCASSINNTSNSSSNESSSIVDHFQKPSSKHVSFS